MAQEGHLNILIYVIITILLGYHAVMSAHMTNGRSRTYRNTQDITSSILLSEENSVVRVNDTVFVICKHSGGLKVGWKGPRGSLDIGQTHPTVRSAMYGTALYFNKARIEDTGSYTCSLTSRPQEKRIFTLIVVDTKTSLIRTDDDDNNIMVSENELVLVGCGHCHGLQVRWKGPRGSLGLNTHPMVLSFPLGSVLVFNKTVVEDTGNYTCRGTDHPQENKVFTFIVEGSHVAKSALSHGHSRTYRDTKDITSSISLSKENLVVSVNETILVICKDSRGRQVGWKGPRGSLGPKTHPTVRSAAYGTALIFNKARIEDTGSYTCSQTSRPQEKRIFTLIVEDNLEFKDTPPIQYTKEFAPKTVLRCETNLKNVTISWLLLNGDHLSTKYKPIADGLVIENVTRQDNQTYVCQAHQQSSGKILATNISLVVKHKPTHPDYVVKAKEVVVYACAGDQVNLTCEVEAVPAPSFVWYHNKRGKVVDVSSHISILMLNMTESIQGPYSCKASNEMGKLDIFFSLILGEKPSSPVNITLLDAMPDSFQLQIHHPPDQLNGTMAPQWFIVEYRPESTEEWQSQEFNSSLEAVLLPDLEKNTEYQIRVATRNIACLSDWYQIVITTSGQNKMPVFDFIIATLLILILNF